MDDLLQMADRYGISARRRRQIKHGSPRVCALTAGGTPVWTGPRWWQVWPLSIAKKVPLQFARLLYGQGL